MHERAIKITNIDTSTITIDYVNNVLENNNLNLSVTNTNDDLLISTDTNEVLNIDNLNDTELNNITDILINNDIRYVCVAKCRDCGEYVLDDYETINTRPSWRDHDYYYVCRDCIDNDTKYFLCSDCEEWYDNTYDRYTYNDTYICEDCKDENYTWCECCDELVYNDDAYYCERHDAYYCESCYEEYHSECEEQNLLYGYHSFRDWQPHHLENETPQFYIGHELEIDNGDNMRQAVDIINDLNGIPMHDGSLSDSGIEFISHPLSYKYMLSLEDDYRQAFDELINLGYKSHNTNTCGLHFHVTRPQDTTIIDRIMLFMETYKEEIILLSRRHANELSRWSRFLSDKRQNLDTKVIKSLDYIVKNKDTYDRYMALNLTNTNTIEFRFFKGTLKYETFMADFEFINNLVEYASNLELPIEKMTWTLITSKGKYLPQYIEEHNLKTDKPIVDYSKELLVKFNEEKEEIKIKLEKYTTDTLHEISTLARRRNNTSQKLEDTYNKIFTLNERLNSLKYMRNSYEHLETLDYNRLNDIKESIKYFEERLGA